MTEVYEVATLLSPLRRGEGRRGAAAARSPCASATPVVRDGRRAATCWRGCRRCSARDVRVHRRALHRPLRAGAGGGRRPAPGRRTRRCERGRGEADRRRATTRRGRAGYIDYAAYRADGGYRAAARLRRRRARRRGGASQTHGRVGPARPGRRRLPGRAQVAHRARPSRRRA